MVTFKLSFDAYSTIKSEGESALSPEAWTALNNAAALLDGVWVVDCSLAVSQEIKEWFEHKAAQCPKDDPERLKTLTRAIAAVREGQKISAGEHQKSDDALPGNGGVKK